MGEVRRHYVKESGLQKLVDSSRKCNFGSRLKEQAALAVLVFSNSFMLFAAHVVMCAKEGYLNFKLQR